ncbi:MAG: response regulator [Candidatus Paceibacterota bacterium]|jgi:DNA-binding response OmpR family regulator|nr:response regulator [Candidatus Paceibacterota bacterium]MDD5621511.1 response regulator [Candidatus Paceibacterota bacterium]
MASKILIVEDDKFLRELISRKLVKEGYDIAEAVDGEEGIKKSEEFMPELILLDLILPGIDGFGTLEKIKDNSKTMNIPVVILSNLGQKDEVERGLKLGAIDFLIKAHFTPEEIVEKIRLVLSKK